MKYTKIYLMLFVSLFISINGQSQNNLISELTNFRSNFQARDFSNCTEVTLDGKLLVSEHRPVGQSVLVAPETGILGVSTVSMSEDKTELIKSIPFLVAIKHKHTNSLYLLTKSAVKEIEISEIFAACKPGDNIVILFDDKQYSLVHNEIKILMGC